MHDMTPQPTLIDYLALAWRRRGLAVLTAIGFAFLVFVGFTLVPSRYQATAVFERRGDAIAARTDMKIPESFNTLKPVLVYELTSPEAVRQALEDVGYTTQLSTGPAWPNAAESESELSIFIRRIRQNLHADWILRSDSLDRVSLTIQCGDPDLASRLANQLVVNYINRASADLREQLGNSHRFLNEQIERTQQRLQQLQDERLAFVMAHPDMLPGDPAFLAERVRQIDTELDDLRIYRQSQQMRLESLRDAQTAGAVPGSGPANPRYASLAGQLDQLRRDLAKALTVKTERHPDVAQLRQTIKTLEQELESLPATLTAQTPAWDAVGNDHALLLALRHSQADIERLDTQAGRLEESRGRYEAVQANLLPVLREYQQLHVAIGDVDNELRTWKRALLDVQMAMDAELNGTRTHLAMIEPATRAYRPIWPQAWMVLGMAIGGGLVFGAVVAILRSRLGRAFDSAGQANQMLGLPVLGVVGPILSPVQQRLRLLRRYALMPALTSLLVFATALAATTWMMSTYYPAQYARVIERMGPDAQALWQQAHSLLGMR